MTLATATNFGEFILAHSILTYSGAAGFGPYTASFTLGALRREYVKCRVNAEVDGFGNPAYRDFEWVSDTLINITSGTEPTADDEVHLIRTMPVDELIHDFTDGAVINEVNLNELALQTIMLCQQFLDGRIDAPLSINLNMGNNRITDMADAIGGQDAVTLNQVIQIIEDTAFSGSTGRLKVSLNDTTAEFLEDKLTVTGALTKTVINEGGNERLELSVTIPPAPDAEDIAFTPSLPFTSTDVQAAIVEAFTLSTDQVNSLISSLKALAYKDKVIDTDVDSTGAANKNVLMANGTGGAGWNPLNGLLINTIYYTCPSQTCTISVASPAVITYPNSGLNRPENGCPVRLTTTGTLPAGLSTDVTYYVVNSIGNTSNLALTPGGTPIVTTDAGSGTHTIQNAPYEKGINNPSFVQVTVVGGTGARVASNSNSGGGGGGGAKKKILAVDLGTSETVTSGAAGNNNPITNGGTSSFGSHCSATGGFTSNAAAYARGGSGIGGDINVTGQSGLVSGTAGHSGGMSAFGLSRGGEGTAQSQPAFGQVGIVIVEEYA